jgi:hypothetical protein
MAALPEVRSSLIEIIDQAFVAQADLAPRAHLGASVLGRECERQIWYSFRWAITENQFDGRMLRLFARGQREEEWFASLLKMAGCEVQTHDSQGRQFSFSEPELGGHLAGSLDGIVCGVPEAPKTWHVLECKTHNDKSFQKLCKAGVEKAKPDHFQQMQLYMRWSGLDRALYLAVNKNDDCLYIERIAYDKDRADQLATKAQRIIEAHEPPARLSDDPTWWQCKTCDFAELCHDTALPSVTCRTCLHATPLTGDRADAAWHCAKWNLEVPLEESRKAQPCHRYIPALIPWAAVIDATDAGDVVYEMKDGSHRTFTNGEVQPGYLSTELRHINPAHIGLVEMIKEAFGARVLESVETDISDENIPF